MKRIGKELSINEEIRAREVRVVSDTNEQLGVMTLHEAIRLSEEKGLDLVEVAPNGKPPVCRIMNYGKYRYEQQKRDKEAKKKQKVFQLKEVKLRPNIEDHDFYVKQRVETYSDRSSRRTRCAIPTATSLNRRTPTPT